MLATNPQELPCLPRGANCIFCQRTTTAETQLKTQLGSIESLYSHAIMIKHEAVAHYREFSTGMRDRGNDALAMLFGQLAEFESEDAFHLAKRAVGMTLPIIPAGEYSWLTHGSPAPEARSFVLSMLTPRLALQIALHGETCAKDCFENVVAESNDPHIRNLAMALARQEITHIDWLHNALALLPEPFVPSETDPIDLAVLQ